MSEGCDHTLVKMEMVVADDPVKRAAELAREAPKETMVVSVRGSTIAWVRAELGTGDVDFYARGSRRGLNRRKIILVVTPADGAVDVLELVADVVLPLLVVPTRSAVMVGRRADLARVGSMFI